ncbi:MAG TPA: response regulator [Polyangiaceae bacterium]|nr:response regulator [Polyangiaceae bacterium]
MAAKILIIDDSASVRRQVSSILSSEGFDIIEAADGIEGSAQIKANNDLALVLCDINMPRLNGLDMLESLTEEIAKHAIPVVMLTTEGEPESMTRARKAGARGWIIKPFKDQLLVGAVKKLTGVEAVR